MARPTLLDLFCCDGGAAMGYYQAGFDVTGIDIVNRPKYPFTFVQADALEYLAEHGHRYDAIHASPPCKAHTVLKSTSSRVHADLLSPTKEILAGHGQPWVIENVPGAAHLMPGALILCGTSFGLGTMCADGKYRPLRRHRLFLSNVFLMGNGCSCTGAQPMGVYGHGGGRPNNRPGRGQYQAPVAEARLAMEMPWASREGVSQAIPPAYTRFLGEQLMAALQ